MGVTIHYKLKQTASRVKSTLDYAQNIALAIANNQANIVGVKMSVERIDDNNLFINIGGCETLAFEFKTFPELADLYQNDSFFNNVDDGSRDIRWKELVSVGFCKTQFSEKLVEHKWVADIIRAVAGRCRATEVYDEGDYFHTGNLNDAESNINEVGEMINGIKGILKEEGWNVEGGSKVTK